MNIGYFDIHNHILPGIDDGAQNMEETIKMLAMEYEDGVRHIIFTPHYVPSSQEEKNIERSERIHKAFLNVVKVCKEQFSDIEFFLGNELYYRNDIIKELEEKRANTMAGSRYILTEFSVNISYEELKKAMQNYLFHGYLPILAHMERYQCLYGRFERMEELKNMGCFLQMNTENFLEGFFSANKRFCTKAVKEGYIDFLGTDSHDSVKRKPTMGQAVKYLEKKVDERLIRKILYENPLEILTKY